MWSNGNSELRGPCYGLGCSLLPLFPSAQAARISLGSQTSAFIVPILSGCYYGTFYIMLCRTESFMLMLTAEWPEYAYWHSLLRIVPSPAVGRNASIKEQFYILCMCIKFGLAYLAREFNSGDRFIIMFLRLTPYRLLSGFRNVWGTCCIHFYVG
jgi:hypothetical protein